MQTITPNSQEDGLPLNLAGHLSVHRNMCISGHEREVMV